ncbi:MAG: InlB B-repeat-containing protein [Dehalococcoidia bacterium]
MRTTIGLLIVAALITATASCVSAACELTVASGAGGSVVAPGNGTFLHAAGDVVGLIAVADPGYLFVNWTGDVDTVADVEAAETTVIMIGSLTITADFEETPPDLYSLTVTGTAGGTVTAPGEGTFEYDPGTVISLAATPTGGYEFINWSGDVSSVADVDSASTTVTVDGDYAIRANFEEVLPDMYSLAVSSSAGGSVTEPGEGKFTYDAGEVVGLTAVAEEGYRFVGWSGDTAVIENAGAISTSITMHGSYSLTGNFEPIAVIRYDLTVANTGGGWVSTPGTGTFSYDQGTVVSLAAYPTGGYRFVEWTGDVGTVDNVNSSSTTITMNGNYSIRANFEPTGSAWYYLSITSTAGGSVTAPGEGTYACSIGMSVSLVATPATGYQFVNWSGDVGTVGNVNASSTTITMNGSYSIRANFSQESSSPPGIDYTAAEAEALIIALVNNERQSYGLAALSQDGLLTSLAREHSISMVENGFFGHERYPGQRPFNYGQQPGTIRGENLAMIPTRRTVPGPYLSLQEVCEWAVSAWMGSPGHRANILESRYVITGVGVAFSHDGNYLYITQMFEGPY